MNMRLMSGLHNRKGGTIRQILTDVVNHILSITYKQNSQVYTPSYTQEAPFP